MNNFRYNLPRTIAFVTLSAFAASTAVSHAGECTVTSGPQRIALLELYTSEGCSSCPPADKWVGELRGNTALKDRVVPLAFHVDYWNQLGWIDPFSQAGFSARQTEQSRRRGASFVFTPQLLLNGQDYRRGFLFDDFSKRLKAINETAAQATVRLQTKRGPAEIDVALDVSLDAGTGTRQAQAFVALYENNLANSIKAGENKGLTLHHDFVVRKLVGPLALDDKGKLTHTERFALAPGWKPADLAPAAFVQDARTGDVLQAIAPRCS